MIVFSYLTINSKYVKIYLILINRQQDKTTIKIKQDH